MQINNFDELVDILQKENVPFRADRESQIVEIAVHTGPLNTEMVIRWEAQLVLAQFIVAFPYQVPSERLASAEHAVTLLNHRLIMPGFGLDGEKGLLYFRLVTPRQEDGSMSYDQIHRLISAAVDTLLDFYPLLIGVVTEGKNADELLSSLAPNLAALPNRTGSAGGDAAQAAAPAETAAAPAAAAAQVETTSANEEKAAAHAETPAAHEEKAAAPAETPAAATVTGEPIATAGVTSEVTGATTQEPAAPAKAAGVTSEAPGVHPQTPADAPQAAEAPAQVAEAAPANPTAAPAEHAAGESQPASTAAPAASPEHPERSNS